jgi:hypothetical protein
MSEELVENNNRNHQNNRRDPRQPSREWRAGIGWDGCGTSV